VAKKFRSNWIIINLWIYCYKKFNLFFSFEILGGWTWWKKWYKIKKYASI